VDLEQIRTARPDAVILDLIMRMMNGWEFIEACRNEELCDLGAAAGAALLHVRRDLRFPRGAVRGEHAACGPILRG
jgi:CheY-like chemotaxis protein